MADIILNQFPEVKKVQYNEYEYQVQYDNYKVLFNDASQDATHLMAVEKDDTLLRFQLPGVAPKETLITDSTIFYPSIYTDVDLSYEIQETKVKETIIINNKGAKHLFNFTTKEKNINASFKEDGSIVYLDSNENELYTIEAPYAFDANNNELEVYVTNSLSGYSVEVKTDENTVYPIYLDPTITMKTTSTYAWFEVSSALTPYGNTAVKEIDLNTFDITSLKVSYVSNTSYYCIYTFKSIDASNVETVLGTVNKTTNVNINVPTGAKKLRIEAAWANNPTTTVYDGIHLVSLTTNTKGLIYGANSYSQNFTTLTTYGTIEDSQVTNMYPVNAIGTAGSILPYYMNSSTGKFVLRYTDDSSAVHNVYITDYSSGLLSEPIPVSKLSGCNCYVYSNSGGTYSSSTYTVEAIFFNNKAISAATIDVALTFDSKRSIAKTNSSTADSKRPVCVAANIHLDTIRTSVQDIILISDTKKMKISNILSNIDLKRALSVSQVVLNDLLRESIITELSNSDLYRTVEVNANITSDTKRELSITNNITYDTDRTTQINNITNIDTMRQLNISDIDVLDIIKSVINSVEISLDNRRTIQINSETLLDSKLEVTKSSELILDITKVINGGQNITLDTSRTILEDTINTLDTLKEIAVENNISLDSLRNTQITSDVLIDTKRSITNDDTSDIFLDTKKIIIKDTSFSMDTDRQIAIANQSTFDSVRLITTEDNLILDTSKQVIQEHVEHLTVDTAKIVVTNEDTIMDTKKVSTVTYDIQMDTLRGTSVTSSDTLDAIKTVQATSVLNADVNRQLVMNTTYKMDLKRQVMLPELENVDILRTVVVSDVLTLDTKRTVNKIINSNLILDTKRQVIANKSLNFDIVRKVEFITASNGFGLYRFNSSTSIYSESTATLLSANYGFKLTRLKVTVATYNAKAGYVPTIKLNGTAFTGNGTFNYTNTLSDLTVYVNTPPKASSGGFDTEVIVSFTEIATDKTIFYEYSATIIPKITITKTCIINKASLDYGTLYPSILVNNVAKTLPYSVKVGDIVTVVSAIPNFYGDSLFLQYTTTNVVTLTCDTRRQTAINKQITIDSKRVISVQDNQTLDTVKKIQQNIASSFDIIRISTCNVSTLFDQMRLISSESNLSLDIFREVVNRYLVHLSADTLRVIQKDVVAKEDLLRNVIAASLHNVDTFRQITLRELIDLDVIRNIERSFILKADTSKKVNKVVLVDYDVKRKVAANSNQTLDTLKVIGINSIYLLNTERIVQAKPVFKVDTDRQVIKDINEYKDILRKISSNVDISIDTLTEVQLRPQLILDVSRMINKEFDLILDTQRVIFMNSSNLHPTLDLSFLLKDGELIELLRNYNNSLEFADSQSPALDVEVIYGSKITITVSKVGEVLEVTINDN